MSTDVANLQVEIEARVLKMSLALIRYLINVTHFFSSKVYVGELEL